MHASGALLQGKT